jgi:Ca2+:H+ antiporter
MNLKWLLIFIPVSLGLSKLHVDPLWVFVTSALSIIPLARLMGDATEALARFMGPTLGGLLNSTLGNAPEIIIGFLALKNGLADMVKASITGALLGNLLFGLGLAMLFGGLRKPREKLFFEPEAARLHGGLLMLATIGLIIPATFNFSTSSEQEISLHIAIVLFVAYLASVAFTLFIGGTDAETEVPEESEEDGGGWSRNQALGVLAVVTLGLAIMGETMTDALDPAAKSMGFTPLFAGVFLLALVGSTAELMNSVRFAKRGQLDLALGITIGGSTQTALLVAPLLVFFGTAIGENMNLLFSQFELIAIVLTVYAIINILQAGSVRWAAGCFLIAVYVMLGIGFYYAPPSLPG